ncbi:MAG: hypothetical protein ACKVTZ_19155 [Bacteroidia bacterium]
MLDLRTFFKNHFNTREVSDDNLRKFVEDHLNRMVANNSTGLYTQIIQDTQVFYDTFNTFIKQEDQTFTSQQGKTMLTDKILADFIALVSRREGTVRAEFGKDSPEYQEFFPMGLNEYHQVSKANAEMLMERMRNKGILYVNNVGQGFVTAFSTILTDFLAARNTQLQVMGEVDTLKSNAAQARQALSIQLMKNLLFIAMQFVGETDRTDDFFSQEMISRKISNENGSNKEAAPANKIINIESQGIIPTTEITFENTGTVPLRIGLSNDDISLPSNVGTVVQSGKLLISTASLLGTGTYLNVENSTNIDGEFTALIL